MVAKILTPYIAQNRKKYQNKKCYSFLICYARNVHMNLANVIGNSDALMNKTHSRNRINATSLHRPLILSLLRHISNLKKNDFLQRLALNPVEWFRIMGEPKTNAKQY